MANKDYWSLSRQELYDLVWATPMTQLSKSFDMSDQGLRKVCINQQIPLPKMGHWAKLAVGKAPAQPPLPEFSEKNKKARQTAAKMQREVERKAEISGWQPPDPPITEDATIQWHPALSAVRKNVLALAKKAEHLKRFHEWESQNPGKRHPDRTRGLYFGSWELMANKGEQFIETQKAYPLRASLTHHLRALQVLNAVLHRATNDGFRVVMSTDEGRFVLTRDEHTVRLRLTEKLEVQFRQEYQSWSKTHVQARVLIPTGRLCIFVEGGSSSLREVADQPGQFLEERLDEVMAVVAKVTESTLRVEEKRREERRKWDAQRRLELERSWAKEIERQRLEDEVAKKAALIAEAESWAKAEVLRKYLGHLDAKLSAGGVPMEGFSEWRIWAESAASELDFSDSRVRGIPLSG